MKTIRLTIDYTLFFIFFGRDDIFQREFYWSEEGYLDKTNGDILFICGDEAEDESFASAHSMSVSELAERRDMIYSSPDTFLLIPEFERSDSHELLQEFFLSSFWTEDKEELRSWAESKYYQLQSIGKWKSAMVKAGKGDLCYEFDAFATGEKEEMAIKWLKRHGITPEWK